MAEMAKMPCYIGAKIICATPMDSKTFAVQIKNEKVDEGAMGQEGYLVVYPDGYRSWSPKGTFETAYRQVTNGERELIY